MSFLRAAKLESKKAKDGVNQLGMRDLNSPGISGCVGPLHPQMKTANTFENYVVMGVLQAAVHQQNNLCRSRDPGQLDRLREKFASFAPGCLLLLKDLAGCFEC